MTNKMFLTQIMIFDKQINFLQTNQFFTNKSIFYKQINFLQKTFFVKQ